MPGSEKTFVATPTASAGGKVIASPFQFYTTGEDNLRVVSANSLPGVSLKIQGRFIDSKGTIGAAAWDHTPNSDRSVRSTDFPLGVGAVMNLTVFASAGTPKIGQTFVIVQLVRGIGAAAIVLGTLLQGYVTASQGLGWPGSPIESSISGGGIPRQITGTLPAPGVEISETVPTNARWELLALFVQLHTTDLATPKAPQLVFSYPGSLSVGVGIQPTELTGNSDALFAWGASLQPATFPGFFWFQAPLPVGAILHAGALFRTITHNLSAATDTWLSNNYLVREWLEVA